MSQDRLNKVFEKAVAIKTVNEVSNLLADNSDYESELKPKLEKLLKFINSFHNTPKSMTKGD